MAAPPAGPRRPGPLLARYLARQMLFPSLYAVAGFTLVVLTQNLLGYSELVVNRGLGVGEVSRIALLEAIPLATRMLPFAVLVGALVTLGRLGSDLELLVLEASGISPRSLVRPLALFAAGMTALALVLSLAVAPRAARSLDERLAEMARSHPSALVRSGQVLKVGDWRLRAREVSADGRELRAVALRSPSIGETLFARRAVLGQGEDGNTAITLREGLALVEGGQRGRLVRFDSLSTELPQAGRSDFQRSAEDRVQGLSLAELRERGRDPEHKRKARIEALQERAQRFALPASTLIFGVLALPLVLWRGVASRAAGAMLGIAATILYYGLVQLGTGLAQAGRVPIEVGAWLPNLLLAGLAGALLLRGGRLSAFQVRERRPSWIARLREAAGRRTLRRAARAPTALSPAPEAPARPVRLRPRRFALQRYVALRFAQMALVSFAVILVAYLLVDVLERLQWFARYQATASEAVRFYGYRIPMLASRVLPMSLLVATSLTVALLAVQGELGAIRACGIGAVRALRPLLWQCAAMVPVAFLLNDAVVPRTNALADDVKEGEIKEQRSVSSVESVWFQVAGLHFEAEFFDPQSGMARGLTLYELTPDGLPASRLDAVQARHLGEGLWRQQQAVAIAPEESGIRLLAPPLWAELGEAVPADVDTDNLSVARLQEEIEAVREDGFDATYLEVDLFVKWAAPLACLVLPALALFFCVSGPPYPGASVSLVVSAVLAVLHVLLSGVSASLGHGGLLPPWAAGWGPVALMAAVAAALAWRQRGFGGGLF